MEAPEINEAALKDDYCEKLNSTRYFYNRDNNECEEIADNACFIMEDFVYGFSTLDKCIRICNAKNVPCFILQVNLNISFLFF